MVQVEAAPPAGRRAVAASLLLLPAFATGCALGPPRIPFTAAEQAAAEVVGLPGVRVWADAPFQAATADWAPRTAGEVVVLALSGGSDSGAYGAGLLNGWTAAGDRPEFTVVTGVSTGALIAPFALLGPRHDADLAALYTRITAPDIFRFRSLLTGVFGVSLADTSPLRRQIAARITSALLEEVAAAHQAGRRLFVVTTNLDAQRAVLWNLGEVAMRGGPQALALFRDVLLASASIPGVFPPVFIEVEAGGRRFQEMHVDGGATSQFFAVPAPMMLGNEDRPPGPQTRLYVLVNKRLEPGFEVIDAGILPIVDRSFDTVLKANTQAMVVATYQFARRSGMPFRLSWIDDGFNEPYGEPFDPAYMRVLFAHGYRRAAAGDAWASAPPGADALSSPSRAGSAMR